MIKQASFFFVIMDGVDNIFPFQFIQKLKTLSLDKAYYTFDRMHR